MEPRLQLVSIVASVGVFALVFELVRRRRLMERYALLWMLAATSLLVMSIWSDLLNQLADALGVQYGPSVLFAVVLGFGFMLMIHFSLVLSRLSDQNKVLAQQLALLQSEQETGDTARTPVAAAAAQPQDDEQLAGGDLRVS
jgi:hypothetical protein